MTDVGVYFDDASAYETMMGRWSRSVGSIFIDWISPVKNARWLDVGCGTGVFTQLIVEAASPEAVSAIDPTPGQIDYARRQPVGQRADFQVADAQALPFPDNSFDIVASALVVNFIPDRPKALAEMRRVGRAGGIVAAYVWDFAGERSPGSVLRAGLRAMGIEVPGVPGSVGANLEGLQALFEHAGLEQIEARTIDVTSSFASFDDLWRAQTPAFNPVTKTAAALPEGERARLRATVRLAMPGNADGSVAQSATAFAIKACIPS